jgi:hypothetical protein
LVWHVASVSQGTSGIPRASYSTCRPVCFPQNSVQQHTNVRGHKNTKRISMDLIPANYGRRDNFQQDIARCSKQHAPIQWR